MKKIFLIAGCALLFSACGAKTLGDSSKKEAPGAGCPSTLRMPEEQIMIFLANPPPARLAITVEGKIKYSECATLRDAPPIVRLERQSGNRLLMKMQRYTHNRASEISFGVQDLKDCVQAPADFIKEEPLVVRYNTEYPDGPKCAGQETARLEVFR